MFRKRMYRTLLSVMILSFTLAPVCLAGEITGYNGGYCYVEMGSYPYEADGTRRPLLWRVLEAEGGRALLLTEDIIDTSQVIFETNQKVIENRTYRRLERFEDSDLCPYLANDVLNSILQGDPLMNALIERPEQGKLFLLTLEEMTNTAFGFTAGQYGENWQHKCRSAKGTPYAIKTRRLYEDPSGYCTYWVGTLHGGSQDYKLWLVSYNGHISAGAYTRVNVGIRPAAMVDLSLITIMGGNGTKEDPFRIGYSGEEPFSASAEEVNGSAAVVPAEVKEIPEAENAEGEPLEMEEATEERTAEESMQSTQAGSKRPVDLIGRGENTVVLSLLGDCSIGDSAQYVTADTSYHTAVDKNGYAWPLSTVYDYLSEDDLTVANLEVVFTNRYAHEDKMYYLRADADHTAILKEGSIEAVNTVNNHAMDFFEKGYYDTMEALDAAKIDHFGTIRGVSDLTLVKEVNGIRFGFTGFTYPAIEGGLNVISRHIAALKEDEHCDVVIVSLHWGRETHPTPESWQQTFSKQLIDAGADVVWGHHPHVLQPMEFYMGKPIFYSTGNFTFGTISDLDPATGIFRLSYDRTEEGVKLTAVQVIPCFTRRGGDYRPLLCTEQADRARVFKELIMKRNTNKCQGMPASFAESGIVYLSDLTE